MFTLHRPASTRPSHPAAPVVIRNALDLQAYLYAPAAPIPSTVRVCAMERLDAKLRAIVTGR